MIEKIESIRCECNKCSYQWMPVAGVAPKVCPKCKSHNWNKIKDPVGK